MESAEVDQSDEEATGDRGAMQCLRSRRTGRTEAGRPSVRASVRMPRALDVRGSAHDSLLVFGQLQIVELNPIGEGFEHPSSWKASRSA